MSEQKNSAFKKWLTTLQQESWSLELLISGFAIFLLLGAYTPLLQLKYQIDLLSAGGTNFQNLNYPYYILLSSWYILIINLVLHVLLRGLWISTIGLRSISGDIDFKMLRLHPKFDGLLKKKIVSFDHYIEQLEKVCSIIFAFTFLIIFILLSVGLIVGTLFLFRMVVNYSRASLGNGISLIFLPILFLFLIGILLYFIDFITFGWVKRKKWLARYYFPIYRFFSLITLSFIYRPIYYNMADNKFGRRVVLFLIPYFLISLFISTLEIRTHAFLPAVRQLQTLDNDAYDDMYDSKQPTGSASISSKFVENGFLELFLPYNPVNDDPVIQAICPELKAAKTGIFIAGLGDRQHWLMNADSALYCSAQRFRIFVNDSLFTDLRYRFHDHPQRKSVGLLTVLDVDYLERGEHTLHVKVKMRANYLQPEELVFIETATIPFWKE